jgi:hypothetical protein
MKKILKIVGVAIALFVSSCNNSTPDNNISQTPTITPTETPLFTPSPSPTPIPTVTPTTTPSPTRTKTSQYYTTDTPSPAATTKAVRKDINVQVFTSDENCQNLVPKQVTVPADEPVANVVGEIIKERDTADFSLSGYRVNVKDGVATVDLRLAADSKRQFSSLSSCEQFALFGSMRKTLTSNPKWNIKEVRFTEKGQEIVL